MMKICDVCGENIVGLSYNSKGDRICSWCVKERQKLYVLLTTAVKEIKETSIDSFNMNKKRRKTTGILFLMIRDLKMENNKMAIKFMRLIK